ARRCPAFSCRLLPPPSSHPLSLHDALPIFRRHALRTALIPLTTVVALGVAGIIEGSILTETVFQWRGLGDFFYQAVENNDSYALLGWLLFSGIIVILANLVADLLYGVLDPRIRYESQRHADKRTSRLLPRSYQGPAHATSDDHHPVLPASSSV